jgi:hypothetical protein
MISLMDKCLDRDVVCAIISAEQCKWIASYVKMFPFTDNLTLWEPAKAQDFAVQNDLSDS